MQLIRTREGLPATLQLRLVNSVADAEELMRWLGERRPVLGVDTETEGLDYWRDGLRMVQIGDINYGWAIPYPEWGGVAKEAIHRYDGPMVMHNAKFDIHFMERAGFKLDRTRIHDTRILAHLLDNDDLTGLKYLSSKYVDQNADYLESQLNSAMTDGKWGWSTIPREHPAYWQYAALDPVITSALFELTEADVAESFRGAYDIELTAQQVLVDMERRGIKVDVKYAQELMLRMWDNCDHLADRGEKEYGISLGSNMQLSEKLLALGAPLTKRTRSGAFSVDEEVLEELTTTISRPEAQLLATMVLQHRHLTKISNTYLKNFIDLADSDGYLHPSLNLLGARTGRMSVSRPSLQNLERTSDVRNAFIPTEGNSLLLVDYDQIEMRLFAHYSGSEELITAFSPGGDVDGFTQMTREIFNDPTIAKSDPRRQTTKNAGYAKIYGAGAAKFAVTAGVDFDAAQSFMARMDSRYPEIDQFIRKVEAAARKRIAHEGIGYVTAGYGNRRLVLHDDSKLYKLVNYLIQGTAAQVLKDRIVALDIAGLGDYLVLPVHDELVFDVPKEEVEEYTRAVQKVMNVNDEFKVPLTTEAKVVNRWGEAYPVGKYMERLDAAA